MKKQEALNYIREKRGFVPYVALFEIFEDNDEIPQALIDAECREDKPQGNFIIGSAKLVEYINKLNNK